MTTYMLIITTRHSDKASALLPAGWAHRARSHDRVYRLYHMNGAPGSDKELRDPVDGDLLVALRSFATEADAVAWIEHDVAQRATLRRSTEKGNPS